MNLENFQNLCLTSYHIRHFGAISVHPELVKWLDLTHGHHRSQAKENG